jgi:hypothetical protein
MNTASKIVSLFERTVIVIDHRLLSPNEKPFAIHVCKFNYHLLRIVLSRLALSVQWMSCGRDMSSHCHHQIALTGGLAERESLLLGSGFILSNTCTLVI